MIESYLERAIFTPIHRPIANLFMASVMKELMDLFYDEKKSDSENYERSFVFDSAISLTNNCHQKSSMEIKTFLEQAFADRRKRSDITPNEQAAWDDALLLLDIYFG